MSRLVQAEGPSATVLWSLRYTHRGHLSNGETRSLIADSVTGFYHLPPSGLDLSLEDDILDVVKEAWKTVVGDEVDDDEFMKFDDRDGTFDQ